MSSIKLSIAEIVKNFNEDVGKYDDILDAFYKNSMPLCEHIRSILQSKEDLKVAYSDLPDSTTILLADPKTMMHYVYVRSHMHASDADKLSRYTYRS